MGTIKLYSSMIFIVLLFIFKIIAHGEPIVPCFFIFGDSMVDSGNNNNIASKGKVNYPPYGIDFPNGPTGRYSNGRTIADVLGQRMGFKDFIKPIQIASCSDILKGVNYASGYSGIRDESGKHMDDRITLNEQLRRHRTITRRISNMLGDQKSANNYLGNCLYLVVTGNNDYINNYFLPSLYKTSKRYSLEKFTNSLIKAYTKQIKALHSYGARKFALAGLGLIGCTPNATAFHDTNGSVCVETMNNAARLFNDGLSSLVDQLNGDLPDAKFVYLNIYNIHSKHIKWTLGGLVKGCCPVNDYGLCYPQKAPCLDRNSLFWDSFHLSEFINLGTGALLYYEVMKIL